MTGALELIILIGAAITGVGIIYVAGKKAWRFGRAVVQKGNHLYDALVGFEQVVDPVSGEVLRAAVPSLNTRTLTIELWQAEVQKTLTRLVEIMERDEALEQRVDALEVRITKLELSSS